MNWCFELACASAPDRAAAAQAWLEGMLPAWRSLPGLTAIDLYLPAAGDAQDPFNHDGAGPLLAMLAFASRDELAAAVRDARFAAALSDMPAGVSLTGTAFERRFYPVGGETRALTAPFSYVVRYHRPAEDEQAFIDNYVATHPSTLAELPGIRSVMCYFRLADDVTAAGVSPADYMIGNEVAFDSIDAFNVAMQSPVRQELRQHFREFPAFTGLNTHFPMQRTRFTG